jgi:hypothetical protein
MRFRAPELDDEQARWSRRLLPDETSRLGRLDRGGPSLSSWTRGKCAQAPNRSTGRTRIRRKAAPLTFDGTRAAIPSGSRDETGLGGGS